MTVQGAGVAVAVVGMVGAGAKAEVTAAGRPMRSENQPVAEENLSMFLILTVLFVV